MARSLTGCILLATVTGLAAAGPFSLPARAADGRATESAGAEAPADAGGPVAEEPDGGLPPLPDLHTVSGTITQVAPAERAITVGAREGPVTLTYDRTTSVYGDGRLGSIRDLVVGTAVRAQFGPEQRAYWIEVIPAGSREHPARARPDGGLAGGASAPHPSGGR